jgi:formylglycine-generating enzyme required for sulfatase activity/transcriptional regulator with XRE-family HTH domain
MPPLGSTISGTNTFVPNSGLSTVEVREVVVTVETSFGRWLQRRRKALDLTQEELAQRVGCAAETLRKIEADVRRPSRQIAERLAEALEIPEADRSAFIKAARAELAVDRLAHPTQDIPQITILPGNTLSSETVSFLFTQITSTFQTKPFDGRCPYKGLDVFEEKDAELFFGRERSVEDLLQRLKESRSVFIIGPSGSGKSSLVRAGLIHALKQGAIGDLNSERWLYETMIPGRDPIGELARVISSMAGTAKAGEEVRANALEDERIFTQWCEIALKEGRDRRAVLFIDQFEEVFTQVSSEEERIIFLNSLIHTATVENGRVIVLFAMRSDFVLNCATYPKLNALFNQQSIQIGAMQPEELVSAIAQPALRVGLRIDPDLVAQIVNDMQGEPGALPLMQFALKDLFDSQQARGGIIALTLNDYLNHGGIHKSLERHADGSFAKLDNNEQDLARSIFSGLIEIGHGTQDTRRTALFDELIPSGSSPADVKVVIQKLADARLITTDEQAGKDIVTISHEKLIDAWPWLRKLVNENRESIALQNQIAEDANQWHEHGQDVSYLYMGARLASACEQLATKKILLSEFVQAFVEAAVARETAQHEQEEARRQKELQDAHLLAEAAQARLSAERRARRGLQALAIVLGLLAIGALTLLARPYVLSSMAQGEMASIAGGVTLIGTDRREASSEERPQWTAMINAFQVDRYEVSNYQYSLCVSARVCSEPKDPTKLHDPRYTDYPVVGVTAFQAARYCRWLGKRLPTELEWERAARGAKGRDWPWGNAASSMKYANMVFGDVSGPGLMEVTELSEGASPVPEHVFNLIGNVWEWTSSYMQNYAHYDPQFYWEDMSKVPAAGLVQRGGSWDDNTLVRVTIRVSVIATDDTRQVGIRCAKSR